MGQTVPDCRQHIINVVAGAELQRLDPTCLAPDWRFLHADIDDVIFATTSRCIRCDLLTQNTFFERDPLQLHTSLFGVGFGNLLHVDHVTVIHDRNCQLGSGCGERCERCRCSECGPQRHFV